MTDPKPWDVLPRQPEGDHNADTLFLAVGRALTAWERLDENQGRLFSAIVSSRQGAAESAYGTVISWASRSQMVTAAADNVFAQPKPELLAEIIDLLNDIGKLSARRTEIAHGIVTNFTVNGEAKGHYLVPSAHNTRKHLSTKARNDSIRALLLSPVSALNEPFWPLHGKYAYTADQISWYANQFRLYSGKLVDLHAKTSAACVELFPSPDNLDRNS